MKKTLTTNEIASRLKEDENAAWTYAGAMALAEWLEEMEESTGKEMELDVVALRCDFNEHESALDWAGDHFGTVAGQDQASEHFGFEDETDEEKEEIVLEYLWNETFVIEFEGGIIVQVF